MSLSLTPDLLANAVLTLLANTALPTEAAIQALVSQVGTSLGASNDVRETALRQVLAKRQIRIQQGFAIQENHTPWVDARRPRIDPYFWNRFKLLTTTQFAPAVVNTFDKTTDEILDLCGNPEETDTWKRRGLVMGDVQSGKTANYSGLICKAADAGYKLVVLLTGTIESLRKQTQERLDESFCGLDSSAYLASQRSRQLVGVGLRDGSRFPAVFTSSSSDFRAQILDNLGLGLATLNEPALLVIKKHAKILNNLRDWLERTNLGRPGDHITLPILVIDDEADNASLNTNDLDSDPTRINQCIRSLLQMFQRSTYVGFTATPFANIFVNPDCTEDEVLGDDLFPKDFVYTLNSPSNYFGAKAIFRDDDTSRSCLRDIPDIEPCLPSNHNSTARPGPLPPSLMDALHSFALANAIRDLRREGPTHRTMMVNVTPYTNVQGALEALLREELKTLQDSIRNFADLSEEEALRDQRLAALHAVWKREYATADQSWPAVQSSLRASVLPITTRCVNQRTGPGALDYRAHKDTGLRVIAVGGNSLSRGLTLEGLCVSYFRRTTKMYDTLLQMGRWFGYRTGYEDICRVWLPEDAADWYGHISEAGEELRRTLVTMKIAGKTPKDFGLAVRAHPGSLMVTARNKMRASKTVERLITLSELSSESVELLPSPGDIRYNYALGKEFVREVVSSGLLPGMVGTARLIPNTPKSYVVKLLRQFRRPLIDVAFQPDAVADLLEASTDAALEYWDIGVPSGDGERFDLGPFGVSLQKRKVMTQQTRPVTIAVSGQRRRVGSRGVEFLGLTREQCNKADNEARKVANDDAVGAGEPEPGKVNTADRFYRAVRSRPLLLLHFLDPELKKGNGPEIPSIIAPLLALGMSFPKLSGEGGNPRVRYVINVVKIREMFPISEDDADDDTLDMASL